MRAGGGKAKGAEFERHVCKCLSVWISASERDDIFWRSAMSGGRASVQFKQGKSNRTQVGDITAIDPLGSILTDKVLIECKFYRNLQILGLITNLKSGINRHWRECRANAERHDLLPMLIARQNRMPIIVCLSERSAEFFSLSERELAHYPHADVVLFWFSDFMQMATL